eukprot:scaffold5786_cov129-Isochrysis_galbana.AAC.2
MPHSAIVRASVFYLHTSSQQLNSGLNWTEKTSDRMTKGYSGPISIIALYPQRYTRCPTLGTASARPGCCFSTATARGRPAASCFAPSAPLSAPASACGGRPSPCPSLAATVGTLATTGWDSGC